MGLIKKTAGAIRVNLVDILIFELLYRIFVFPVFLFALEQGLRLAMEAAGFSYITEENLAGFLIRPATLLLLCHQQTASCKTLIFLFDESVY